MNLGAIVNAGDEGGILTANSDPSLTIRAPPASQGRQNAMKRTHSTSGRGPGPSALPSNKSKPSRARTKRPAKKPVSRRGGAKTKHSKSHNEPSSRARPELPIPRHLRHRQPPRRVAGDRTHTPRPPSQAAAASASLPPSSPAKDLLRRARETVAVDTDWLGRRPFVMDIILGHRPAVAQYSEDAVMEAIELSEAALGLWPARGRLRLEDARSLELYWEAQAARTRLGADDGAQHTPVPDFQLSAERSTVAWGAGDEDAGECEAPSPSSSDGSFPRSGNAAAHEC